MFYSILVNLFPVKEINLPSYFENRKSLIEWLKKNTAPTAVFLANFELSPSILTYTDRTIILHPKFENKQYRQKFKEYIFALFDDEDTFFDLCKRVKADYYVYQVGTVLNVSKDGLRYLTDNLNLNKKSSAYKFHFTPFDLEHFQLVYETRNYRIFKILKNNKERINYKIPSYYRAEFDIRIFQEETAKKQFLNKEETLYGFACILSKDRYLKSGLSFYKKGDFRNALEYLNKALKMDVPDIKLYQTLGTIYSETKDFDSAIFVLKKSIKYFPKEILPYISLTIVYYEKRDYQSALNICKKAVEIEPENQLVMDAYKLVTKSISEQ
ncbi:MAG: tetratricopeptide repeat protein [Elusimicrobiota bacterium]